MAQAPRRKFQRFRRPRQSEPSRQPNQNEPQHPQKTYGDTCLELNPITLSSQENFNEARNHIINQNAIILLSPRRH